MVLKQAFRALTPALVMTIGMAALAHAKPDATLIEEWRASQASATYPNGVVDAGGSDRGQAERLFQAASGQVRRPGPVQPNAIPDIFGPGAVLNVGNVYMKVTNFGTIGNPFTNISNDPSGQWPGASGTEYLSFMLLSVGAVNPTATDPTALRRVSYFSEWRPPTPDPEDRMYRAYDGIVNGQRLVDDDQDDKTPEDSRDLVDEDFLDGRDNDGDNKIDEDYGAFGQQMFSCLIRDDTQAAISTVFNEKHVPLGLECQQTAWAYSVNGLADFDPIQFKVFNRSGHTLDSMYFGIRIDQDCGPLQAANFFVDDFDAPFFPHGQFNLALDQSDKQRQFVTDVNGDTATLCNTLPIRVNGFSVVDNDGDEGRTNGIGSLLLLGHTTDPLGVRAPTRVGWRAFRSYIGGTPYTSNGNPAIDQERYEFMSSTQNISPYDNQTLESAMATGWIESVQGDQEGDYQAWASAGPFLNVPDGGSIELTIAFSVQRGDLRTANEYPQDYQRYLDGRLSTADLFNKYPVVANAFAAQVSYEGKYELPRTGFGDKVPNCAGCETAVRLGPGEPPRLFPEPNCPGRPEPGQKLVTADAYTWFDYDCNFCTGVFDQATSTGYYLRRWVAESPPPNPNLNTATSYNYTDNPNRISPSGDRRVTIAWDNLSETTPDPKSNVFDFKRYLIWKVAGWRRPVGSSGPTDDDWQLLAEFEQFGSPVCSTFYVPQRRDTQTICLEAGEFLDRQSGAVLRPNPVTCIRPEGWIPGNPDSCVQDSGYVFNPANGERILLKRDRFPVGRYTFVDTEVKNGFTYFYSVTAADDDRQQGRRAAVEAEGVSPQSSAGTGKGVWVVPNPYRGYRNLSERPSAWDLTPNASDPTGTHIDFLGLPDGGWTVRIYTVSGDLVTELKSDDPVNDSVRGPVTGTDGITRDGFNRQQDGPGDGQARWNLISRNGQDVVSGIYMFVVDSSQGQQRGKFVIIR